MTDGNGEIRRVHGPNGRFLPGNPGGPPGPKKPAWTAELSKALPAKRLRGLLEKLIQCAEEGQPWAFRELLPYVLGKPVETQQIQSLHVSVAYLESQPRLDDPA